MRENIFWASQGFRYIEAAVGDGYYIVCEASPHGEMVTSQLYKQYNDTLMFGKKVEITHISGQERWDKAQALKVSNA
jgi:hypothetical protein